MNIYNHKKHERIPTRSIRNHHNVDRNSRVMMQDRRMRYNNLPYYNYFFCCLAMTFVQAVGMILFGLCFSYSLHNNTNHDQYHRPMESTLIVSQNLWIQHYHRHHKNEEVLPFGVDDDDNNNNAPPLKDAILLANDDLTPEYHLQQPPFRSANKGVIINEVMEQLLQAVKNDNTTAALDDYYRRRRRSTTSAIETATSVADRTDLPILIIGGSDGSGTRAFADLVAKLGVPMLVDDQGTLDVHAPIIFSRQKSEHQQKQQPNGDTNHYEKKHPGGWPPLVRLVMEETHSADYQEETDLSSTSLQMALHELRRFQLSYAPRVKDLLQNATEHHENVAMGVQYGFKAPVSMLLLPLLRKTLGRIKFLHVVRDGRDVSFSRNTSPVSKFYTSFYRDATNKLQSIQATGVDQLSNSSVSVIQAMQLWNDWNRQVWDWESRTSRDENNNFDFLVLRTEDLLLSPETKFESLVKLADFVGSPLTTDELCCLSRQAVVDMGQSAMNDKRTSHRDRFWLSPPDTDGHSGWRGQPSKNDADHEEAIMNYLDDPSDITLQDVALESERKALNLALEKRPQLFQKIQQARKDNFATHHHHEEKFRKGTVTALKQQQHHQQRSRDKISGGTWASGLGRVWAGGSAGRGSTTVQHPPVRRRLHETRNKNRNLEDASERFREIVDRKEAGNHMRGRGHKEPQRRRRQTPEMVLQRYGKWKSALEGRPELSRILHEEGSDALRIFGYEPPRRFADLPPNGLPNCPATCP